MRLSHFFIERPVFAAVVAILIVLVGAIAYGKTLRPEVAQTLDQQRIPRFHLAQDGAVQWSPRGGFKTSFSVDDAEFARL